MTARIVIVEDDADTRCLLEAFTLAEGYAAVSAENGENALELLSSLPPPDLILLDAVMPGLDGFETCRRIKANRETTHVPVIFMTGLSDNDDIVRGLAAGGVDYVTKPVELEVLAARIRVHIETARTTRSAMSALATVGSRMLSCERSGQIIWTTPEAGHLLDELDLDATEELRHHIRKLAGRGTQGSSSFALGGETMTLTLIEANAEGECLLKLSRSGGGLEVEVLQKEFRLTPREADVLLWTSRGKSNKDMSEILNISARTVNKHLEQIFLKIGVENRASAAASATRALMQAE